MKGKLNLNFNPKTSNVKSTGSISYFNDKIRGAVQLCDDPLALTMTATGGS
jgi:hypothetical protein